MKKYIVIPLLLIVAMPILARAATVQEEVEEGRTIWENIGGKTVDCATLSDDQFEKVGEFFMGRMMGDAHESMNTTMRQMLGKEGEEQMHMTMGKRMSGCETGTVSGTTWNGMMSGMMPMMMQGGGMMGWGGRGGLSPWWMLGGFGVGLGAIVMLSFWVLVLVLLVGLVRWVWRRGNEKK